MWFHSSLKAYQLKYKTIMDDENQEYIITTIDENWYKYGKISVASLACKDNVFCLDDLKRELMFDVRMCPFA